MQKMSTSSRAIASNRLPSLVLVGIGFTLVILGSGAVIWGSLLPWLTVKVFDVAIVVPGVVGLGAATAAIGLLTLTRSRSYPPITLLLGLLCLFIGNAAPIVIGRQVARQVLEIKQRLSPINERLEQVNLPPIEPFTGGVISQNYVGSGPLWTFWGGAMLVAGATLQFAGNRLRRTCAACGQYWHPGRDISFCSHCGAVASDLLRCKRCLEPLEKEDQFCVHCGTSTVGTNRSLETTREPDTNTIA